MVESEFAFVANYLTIIRVIKLFDNLADYSSICQKCQLMHAKGEVNGIKEFFH